MLTLAAEGVIGNVGKAALGISAVVCAAGLAGVTGSVVAAADKAGVTCSVAAEADGVADSVATAAETAAGLASSTADLGCVRQGCRLPMVLSDWQGTGRPMGTGAPRNLGPLSST